MDKNKLLTQRNQYINNLQQFLSSSKKSLQEIMHNLDWSTEKTIYKDHEKNFTSCPLNSGHSLPVEKLENHMKTCLWHQEGYDKESVPLPPPLMNSSSSILIDKELQANIILKAASENCNMKTAHRTKSLHLLLNHRANVRERNVPQTADRLFSDFTTDERRVLYDFAVQQTRAAVPELKEFSLPTEAERRKEPMTREQLMAAERDAKRRRVRHRAAKVHTKSKNYSEVMREVINNQMETYEEWLKDELGIVDQTKPSEPEDLTKSEKEKEKKNEEPKWLDWSFRDNPYNWWRHLLQKEKRRIERGEIDRGKRSENRESGSRRSDSKYYRNEDSDSRRKYDYDRHDRFYKDSKTFKSGKDHYSSEQERSDRNREKLHSYRSSRHKDVRHEGDEKYRHKRENKYDSRESYNVSKRKKSHHDEANGKKSGKESYDNDERRQCLKDEGHELKVKTDQDHMDQEFNNEYHDSKRQKSDESVKVKQESEGEIVSGSDVRSNISSSSSHTKKSRRKKSKKKHSHKHKSKKKKKNMHSEKYNPMKSTDESSIE